MANIENRKVWIPEELEPRGVTYDMLHGAGRISKQKILILGGGGYLGCILARLLVEDNYDVTVLDRFFYEPQSLQRMRGLNNITIHCGDIRDRELLEHVMEGKDAVVNLAAIVGDEACRINPGATVDINVRTIRLIARFARQAGVRRILHTSTCSTYGKNCGGLLNENIKLEPLSLYAESKVESERVLMEETDNGTAPACCILRLSTLFGYSHRPRFDLVVNTFTGHAWKHGKITIFGGNQWRPFLHVGDAARALKTAIEAPADRVAGMIYNTGGEDLNLTIMQVGRMIREVLPRIELNVKAGSVDERDYRVDFSLIRENLGFDPAYSISNGVLELVHALDTGEMIDPEHPVYSNCKWLTDNPELLEEPAVLV